MWLIESLWVIPSLNNASTIGYASFQKIYNAKGPKANVMDIVFMDER
jgi:hypothetical protein